MITATNLLKIHKAACFRDNIAPDGLMLSLLRYAIRDDRTYRAFEQLVN